jgi:capsular polysaccharide biosynthesis protein/Mrp family chromosome partitioning ATPase
VELSDILGSIRRHLRISIGILLAAVVLLVAFLVTRQQVLPAKRYEGTVQILIPARTEEGERPEGVPPVLLQGQVTLAQNETTKADALERGGFNEEDRRRITLVAFLNEAGDIMTVAARAPDASLARAAADAYAEAFTSARRETVSITTASAQRNARQSLVVLNDRLADIESQLREEGIELPDFVANETGEDAAPTSIDVGSGLTLDQELLIYSRNAIINDIRSTRDTFAQLGSDALTPRSYSDIVERPAPRTITPEPPSPLIPVGIALGAGLLLALAVPVLMDRFDHTIKDARTASGTLGTPVLAAIPAWSKADDRTVPAPGTELDRAYRSLAATSVATDRLPRSLLVSSPSGTPQDAVAAAYAVALAEMGVRVVLIGTNPGHDWYSGVKPVEELEGTRFPDLLARAHAGELDASVLPQLASPEIANLFVVAPGEDDAETLSLDGLPPLLSALTTEGVDIVIIAGPPFLEDPNATILSWATRHVLWCVRLGAVTDAEAREAASRLELAGVSPFGLALIGRES